MKRTSFPVVLVAALLAALAGCAMQDRSAVFHDDLRHYQQILAETDYQDACTPPQVVAPDTPPPLGLRQEGEPEYWPLGLEESIRLGLASATVLNDLGGALLQSPQTVAALQDPSLVETDPRFGVQAALSEFDAELTANAFFEKNDRVLNNQYTYGTHGLLQDKHDYDVGLRKRSASGAEYQLRQIWQYDANNANGNIFPSYWNTFIEGEVRQPLLRGAGLEFNRIAGPFGTPGNLNGVVIARINTDISLADLELGLRDYVSNIENTYWDLYYAYRDLDAKRRARDESLDVWRKLSAQGVAGLPGAEDDKIAQAREQFFRFEMEVENALSGRPVEGTQARNDSTGGSFRANGGVYITERRLRLLLGLPVNGGQLIRPSDEPSLAKVVFDWDSVVGESLTRRAELRRQRLAIQRQEMELLANQNFLRPRLDAVGRYRWRGFGNDLIASDRSGIPRYDNAYADLTTGDYQEWMLGVEFSMPLGFRHAHAAIRNAQLAVAREKAILQQQERQVIHDLSNAISEMERAYKVAQVNLNRYRAAEERLTVLRVKAEEGNITFVNLTLDAQQRLASAESDFFRSLVEYILAVKNVHVEKGTWKNFHNIEFAEDLAYSCGGASPLPAPAADADAAGLPPPPVPEAPSSGNPADAPPAGMSPPMNPNPAAQPPAPPPGLEMPPPPEPATVFPAAFRSPLPPPVIESPPVGRAWDAMAAPETREIPDGRIPAHRLPAESGSSWSPAPDVPEQPASPPFGPPSGVRDIDLTPPPELFETPIEASLSG